MDDDASIRSAVTRLLRHLGHPVESAASGAHALALARAHPFDLVVCDLNMPGMSGLELHAALAAENLLGAGLFALVTGEGSDAQWLGIPEGGRLVVLRKPFGVGSLSGLAAGSAGLPEAGRA